jgi:hypothetical protein
VQSDVGKKKQSDVSKGKEEKKQSDVKKGKEDKKPEDWLKKSSIFLSCHTGNATSLDTI